MPGMAAREPTSAEPRASDHPVDRNCFLSEFGTGGVEATSLAEQRTDQQLIQRDQPNNDFSHSLAAVSKSESSARAGIASARTTGRRARTSTSYPARRCCSWRNVSRIRRFRKFRATACWTVRLPTMIPRRAKDSWFCTVCTINRPLLATDFEANSTLNGAGPLSRARARSAFRGFRPRAVSGPSPVGC